MNKWNILTLLALVCLALPLTARAQPPGARGGAPSYDRLLDAFDDNDDGELSEEEVPAGVWRRLGQADANDDGVVTRGEFNDYRKKRTGGR